jgi:hypothetical protein
MNSAHFGLKDVFTALKYDFAVDLDFESNESFTIDESPLPISFRIHSTCDESEMTGIVVGVFNRSNELSN